MKSIILSGILALGLATTASAQDMFASMEASEAGSTVISINPINVSEDGFIVIYDHNGGQIGEVLGMARVRAGANAETKVSLGYPVRNDVIAVLFAGSDTSDPSTGIDSIEIEGDR